MDDPGVLVRGLAFSGFRSFSDDLQYIGPMSKVHLLAGPNNSGKSNVLTFAQRVLPQLRGGTAPALTPVDFPRGPQGPIEQPVRVAVGVALPSPERMEEIVGDSHRAALLTDWLTTTETFMGDGRGLVWFHFEAPYVPNTGFAAWQIAPDQLQAFITTVDAGESGLLAHWAMSWTNQYGDPELNAKQVLDYLEKMLEVRSSIPKIEEIPAFRRIGASDNTIGEHGGYGLIQRLGALQHPDDANAADTERFEAINRFIKVLFEDGDARLEVTHTSDLLVHHNSRRLPLENYGTGLHEVVILAVAATVISDALVCVEEPEVHLHPTLQRKLLRYLTDTDNQYLIATHSAHLLDTGLASISAVHLVAGHSEVAPAVEPSEVAAISLALGFRASDLVQSNAVIWVEGPSDRIYIRHWISTLAPELVEGVHYSVMFYGGRLLKHLDADEPAVEEFVSLPRINRNFAVVMDSDREDSDAPLGDAKVRIRDTVQGLPNGAAWITEGYTIENYVPPELLASAVAAVYPHAKCIWNGDPHVAPLREDQIEGRTSKVDKIQIAQAVVEAWTEEHPWPMDLRGQVDALVNVVRHANDLPAPV